ncbi:MAG TPA: choline kinase family protein [Actinomycetota bacterium]|nr:choline kinase family protein [Actinomycetota bacterium]
MPTIEQVVERVTLWDGLDTDVSELSGGLTNTNYVVTAGDDRYVVRIPGRSTELLAVDRGNERHNAEAAATTGVAPRIVEYLEDWNVMVLEFIDGKTMSGDRLRAPGQARRVAESLRRLHAGPRFRDDFDMFRLTDRYLRVCDMRDVPIPVGFRDRLGQVAEIERAFDANPVPSVPCHNDLLAENYIDDGRQLWIVDFEYSGNNDPCFELGDTAQESEFDPELRAQLCEAYFGEARDDRLARMNLQALMADVGWTLWAAIQTRVSEIEYDFWGWAVERWERALAILDSEDFGRWVRSSAQG